MTGARDDRLDDDRPHDPWSNGDGPGDDRPAADRPEDGWPEDGWPEDGWARGDAPAGDEQEHDPSPLGVPPVPLRFPRPALLSAAVLAAAGVGAVAMCGWVLGGWAAASVAVGVVVALVILFASVSVLYLADRLDNRLALPTAFGLFVFCVLVLLLIRFRLTDQGTVRRAPVGLAVLGSAVLWTVAYVAATIAGLRRPRVPHRLPD